MRSSLGLPPLPTSPLPCTGSYTAGLAYVAFPVQHSRPVRNHLIVCCAKHTLPSHLSPFDTLPRSSQSVGFCKNLLAVMTVTFIVTFDGSGHVGQKAPEPPPLPLFPSPPLPRAKKKDRIARPRHRPQRRCTQGQTCAGQEQAQGADTEPGADTEWNRRRSNREWMTNQEG